MRQVFIATSFDAESRQRADQMAEMLGLIGCHCVFGENMQGAEISLGVRKRIESSLCLLGLLTRRDLAGDKWYPSQWVVQEIIWAEAKNVPSLVMLEDGVFVTGPISNKEQIRFNETTFSTAMIKAASEVKRLLAARGAPVALMPVNEVRELPVISHVPADEIEDDWGPEVKAQIQEVREFARRQEFSSALKTCELILTDRTDCWRAWISKGVALAHLRRITESEQVFAEMSAVFVKHDAAMAKCLHNRAWVISLRDGWTSATRESIQLRHDLYKASLDRDHTRLGSRASLLICKVLLGNLDEAEHFLRDSLKQKGFYDALREEIDTLGSFGQRIVRNLPDWLADIMYPIRDMGLAEGDGI